MDSKLYEASFRHLESRQIFPKVKERERQVILLNCKVMAQMSVPPVPVPGGDEDHLFEKITLQHS